MGKVIYIEKFNNIGGMNMSKQKIELLAHDVLEAHDIYTLPVDPIIIANNLGIKVYAEDYDPFNGDIVSGAIVKHENGSIEIYVNKNDSYERQRFTIAHELGHYFIHLQNAPSFERVDMHRATGYSTSMPQEVEANNFAASLLMDRNMVIEKFVLTKDFNFSELKSIEYLANLFGVSKSAMQYRLINLGLI